MGSIGPHTPERVLPPLVSPALGVCCGSSTDPVPTSFPCPPHCRVSRLHRWTGPCSCLTGPSPLPRHHPSPPSCHAHMPITESSVQCGHSSQKMRLTFCLPPWHRSTHLPQMPCPQPRPWTTEVTSFSGPSRAFLAAPHSHADYTAPQDLVSGLISHTLRNHSRGGLGSV